MPVMPYLRDLIKKIQKWNSRLAWKYAEEQWKSKRTVSGVDFKWEGVIGIAKELRRSSIVTTWVAKYQRRTSLKIKEKWGSATRSTGGVSGKDEQTKMGLRAIAL